MDWRTYSSVSVTASPPRRIACHAGEKGSALRLALPGYLFALGVRAPGQSGRGTAARWPTFVEPGRPQRARPPLLQREPTLPQAGIMAAAIREDLKRAYRLTRWATVRRGVAATVARAARRGMSRHCRTGAISRVWLIGCAVLVASGTPLDAQQPPAPLAAFLRQQIGLTPSLIASLSGVNRS